MARKPSTFGNTGAHGRAKTGDRVTLALRLADGTLVEIEGGIHAMRFIGRYSRISAFGPLGTRITAKLVARS